MNIEVVEMELICRSHGAHKLIIPVAMPRPRNCVHCFLPAERRELRRFFMDGPLTTGVGSEAYLG